MTMSVVVDCMDEADIRAKISILRKLLPNDDPDRALRENETSLRVNTADVASVHAALLQVNGLMKPFYVSAEGHDEEIEHFDMQMFLNDQPRTAYHSSHDYLKHKLWAVLRDIVDNEHVYVGHLKQPGFMKGLARPRGMRQANFGVLVNYIHHQISMYPHIRDLPPTPAYWRAPNRRL